MNPASTKAPVVLVTGVSGFIGGFLARDLAGRGYRVIGTARRPSKTPPDVIAACEKVLLTHVGHSTDWSRLIAGVDFVVHCAAHVHIRNPSHRDRELFHDVNVEGTRALAKACRDSGVSLLVHLSSIAAEMQDDHQQSFGYGRSKLAAEQAIESTLVSSTCRFLNFRLPAVYGPNGKGSLAFLLRLVKWGVPMPRLSDSAKRSYLSVWNLADCVGRCLSQAPLLRNGTVGLADGPPMDLNELISVMSAAAGKTPVWLSAGEFVVRWVALLAGRGRELQQSRVPVVIDPIEAAVKLGWTASVSADEGWARTVRGAKATRD